MAGVVVLLIGTKKGLWVATSRDGRASWDVSGPHFRTTEVPSVAIDTRRATPRLLVGASSTHFGPSVAVSDDLGSTWQEPEQAPIAFPADTDAVLARVWQLAPGPESEPDVVYAGVEPTALFRSADGGVTYELVRPLWDHPHRKDWAPGAGGAAVHTVIPHRTEPKITVAMSTGGVYRSADGGASWAPANAGIRADFFPDKYPEYGQCVHKIAQHPDRPERWFAQNHGGVYRSDDDAHSWQSIAEGLPADFGFPIVVHPSRPDVVYTFPLISDMNRYPADGRCRVYRSDDAGQTWTALGAGLPAEFWSVVLRDALCTDGMDPAGLYLGTRSGAVYASRDDGEHWQPVAEHLPDVLSVRAAAI